MGNNQLKKNELKEVRSLFWEYDVKGLDLLKDRELIIKRVLSHGSVEDLKWLRRVVGDEEIKRFLLKTKGRGIDRRRLRFYQVVFRLPADEVDSWLKDPARKIWDNRCRGKEDS